MNAHAQLYTHVTVVDGLKKILPDNSINPQWIEFLSASYKQLGLRIKAKIKNHYSKESFNCKKCKSYKNGSPLCPYFEWYDIHYTFDQNSESGIGLEKSASEVESSMVLKGYKKSNEPNSNPKRALESSSNACTSHEKKLKKTSSIDESKVKSVLPSNELINLNLKQTRSRTLKAESEALKTIETNEVIADCNNNNLLSEKANTDAVAQKIDDIAVESKGPKRRRTIRRNVVSISDDDKENENEAQFNCAKLRHDSDQESSGLNDSIIFESTIPINNENDDGAQDRARESINLFINRSSYLQ